RRAAQGGATAQSGNHRDLAAEDAETSAGDLADELAGQDQAVQGIEVLLARTIDVDEDATHIPATGGCRRGDGGDVDAQLLAQGHPAAVLQDQDPALVAWGLAAQDRQEVADHGGHGAFLGPGGLGAVSAEPGTGVVVGEDGRGLAQDPGEGPEPG